MKKIVLALSLILSIGNVFGGIAPHWTMCVNTTNKEEYPCFVQDISNMLSPNAQQLLEDKLYNYEKQTSIEMAIVIVPSLNGYDAATYTQAIFDEWGVGKQGKDNGVVILISNEPGNRDWRIQPGYGLEEWITDYKCSELGRERLVPYLKSGDTYAGLNTITDDLMKLVGTQTAQERDVFITQRQEQKKVEKVEREREMAETSAALTKIFTWVGVIIGLIIAAIFIYIFGGAYLKLRGKKKADLKKAYDDYNTEYEKVSKLITSNPTMVTTEIQNQFHSFYSGKLQDHWSFSGLDKDTAELRNQKKSLTELIAPIETVLKAREHFIGSPIIMNHAISLAHRLYTDNVKDSTFWDQSEIDPKTYTEKIDKLFYGVTPNPNDEVNHINQIVANGNAVVKQYTELVQKIVNCYQVKQAADTIIREHGIVIGRLATLNKTSIDLVYEISKTQPNSIWEYTKLTQKDGSKEHVENMIQVVSVIPGLLKERQYGDVDKMVRLYNTSVTAINKWHGDIRGFFDEIKTAIASNDRNERKIDQLSVDVASYKSRSHVSSSAKLMEMDYQSFVSRFKKGKNVMERQKLFTDAYNKGNEFITKAKADIKKATTPTYTSTYRSSTPSYRRSSSPHTTTRSWGGGRSGGAGAGGKW